MERKKILIVDDEELILRSLSREIGLQGYETATAGGGEEGIAMLQHDNFDLLITDLIMPGIDGIGVLQAAKKISPEICVIILTGHGDLSAAIRALRLGADDFLLKPFEMNELFFRITGCCDKQNLLRQLSRQNRLLQQEITKRQQVEKELSLSEGRFRLALDASSDGLWERNLQTNEEYYGENWHRTLGFSDEEAINTASSWKNLIHLDDRKKTMSILQDHIDGKTPVYEAEFRLRNKEGLYRWILSRGKVVSWDEEGHPLRVLGTHTDITRLKHVEASLKHAQEDLERKVQDRTIELEETNIALKVLLRKREEDQAAFEQQVFSNVTHLVEPYLNKLEKSRLNGQQTVLLEIIKSSINELTSSFGQHFSSKFSRLTPMEIQVADLIRQGKMSKEIAEVMNISPGTINIHRKNIRRKLGLTHTKTNLQTILSSF